MNITIYGRTCIIDDCNKISLVEIGTSRKLKALLSPKSISRYLVLDQCHVT